MLQGNVDMALVDEKNILLIPRLANNAGYRGFAHPTANITAKKYRTR